MPCYKPVRAFRSSARDALGKYTVAFSRQRPGDQEVELPCGRCIGCRLERSRQWAVRCVHEASTCPKGASFITLTYDDNHLPSPPTIQKEDLQLFWKRLRKKYVPKCPFPVWIDGPDGKTVKNPRREKWLRENGVRYFACGEYGDQPMPGSLSGKLGRPHYHAILFNHDFIGEHVIRRPNGKDYRALAKGVTLEEQDGDNRQYSSKDLESLWSHPETGKLIGRCRVSPVTFESAAYVARYQVKKITGDLAKEHYQYLDYETGEISQLQPEALFASNGIGKDWYTTYKQDLEKDYITTRGVRMRPPKYYDRLLEQEDPEKLALIKRNREENIDPDDPERSPERLAVKEQVKKIRTKQLKRKLA